ncbi:SIR2 family NAD-dependent protein deacylase [Desmospora profundinema]|uniref:protein acetyllysine N-acetyltransferase n=1 Tax=Desmospora profundinema TaxID=1571184 RepID=A0ABU1IME7_9BACL|nr:NAD-dependent deacylase [Desmospora profundinema]MDR6225962.1 NAD-dependent deacetylase [Desmospora profundinema]
MESDIHQLAGWIQEAGSTVVLTGAGMSTESGVPDFRSREGFWKRVDPQQVATVSALEEDYETFHRFYRLRVRGVERVHPHIGHEVLTHWEHQGRIYGIATQNVDRLHQRAGSRQVWELHGNLMQFHCYDCKEPAERSRFLEKDACLSCGGRLRPGIVLFGEWLPEAVWVEAMEAVQQAELLLIIGTSLEVYPVNQMPTLCRGKSVLINAAETQMDHQLDLMIRGKAGQVLKQVEQALNKEGEG